jgi:hypothetical protein
LRKRAIAAALMVIGASLIWTTAALAGPTQVTVRIEGKEKTLFEGPILTEGHAVQALSDTEAHPCDATNNHAHPEAMATPTASAADAMQMTGQVWDALWYEGFDDYYLTQFGPDHESTPESAWWGVLVNGVFTPVGGCQFGDRAGDEVLWAYDAFTGRRFLWMAAAGDSTPAPKSPLPTAYVEVGQPLTLLVESGEGSGSMSRSEGVTVAPVATDPVNGNETVETGSPDAVVTNSEGAAEITFATPGWHRLKAQEESGFIRSNRIDVCVEPEGGGGCGARPEDAQLRTLPIEPEPEPETGNKTPPTGSGGEIVRTVETTKTVIESQKQPTNEASLGRATVDPKSGTATLSVTLPGAGHLSLAGKKTVGKELDAAAAGVVELTIEPTAKEKKALRKRGKLRVGVKLTYTPTGGMSVATWRSVLLKTGAKK